MTRIITLLLVFALFSDLQARRSQEDIPYAFLNYNLPFYNDIYLQDSTLNEVRPSLGIGASQSVGFGIGTHLTDWWRVEVEYQLNTAEIQDWFQDGVQAGQATGALLHNDLFFNTKFDYRFGNSDWLVYAGGGLGLADVVMRDLVIQRESEIVGPQSSNNFALGIQGSVGIMWEPIRGSFLEFGYNYYRTSLVNLGTTKFRIVVHRPQIGFRINFN